MDADANLQGLCPVCQTAVERTDETTACPSCETSYHVACWQENSGCAIYGCEAAALVEPRRAIEMPASYWGREEKACPACAQSIQAAALRCRHCGAVFPSAAPLATDSFHETQERKALTPRLARSVTVLFVFSVVPCTAPLAVFAGLIWRATHARDLNALPALHQALSKLGVWVAAGQTILFLVVLAVYTLTQAP